jgi:hypothetical protein
MPKDVSQILMDAALQCRASPAAWRYVAEFDLNVRKIEFFRIKNLAEVFVVKYNFKVYFPSFAFYSNFIITVLSYASMYGNSHRVNLTHIDPP